jgi:hypothetical protein
MSEILMRPVHFPPLVGSDSLPMDEYYQDQIETYGLDQGERVGGVLAGFDRTTSGAIGQP